MGRSIISSVLLSAGLLIFSVVSNPAAAATCIGNCGTLGPDGVVGSSPLGGTYGYVSTNGGVNGNVPNPPPNLTNGSTLTTGLFTANAGDVLNYWFDYVTSDGGQYLDYAYTNLLDSTGAVVAQIFTYTTNNTPVPILNPGAANTVFSPLGSSSGTCWSTGCGNTGWLNTSYTVGTAGQYMLQFGVANSLDTLYDSAMAFDGVTIGGNPVPISAVPEPSTYAMLLAGLGLIGFIARRKNQQGGMMTSFA